MKPGRRILISAVVCSAVLAILVAVATMPAFQTWAARRYLAKHPELHLSLGRVAAGLHRVELTDVTLTNARLHASVPRLTAEMDVLALLLHRRLDAEDIVAHGWTAEVLAPGSPPSHAAAGPGGVGRANAAAPGPNNNSATELRGILSQASLPLPATLDAVDLDGVIRLRSGTAKVHLTGGGFGAGRTGTLRYTIDADRQGANPAAVRVTGSGTGVMGSDREFTQLQLRFEATASGGKLEQPVTLQTQVEIARTGNLERYGFALSGKRPLLNATAELAEGARSLRGSWSIDLTDADVAPFALGHPLPAFSATGAGQFDADTALTSSHGSGTIAVAIDRLGIVSRSLAEIGPVKLNIDADVAQRGAAVSVSRLNAAVIAADAPVATVRALQRFEFEPRTRSLQAADANAPLLGVTIDGLPLRWVKPFLVGFAIDGNALRGELTATPRAGGLSFATRAPLTVAHVSVFRAQEPLLREIDVAATISGDYLPQGWQIECRDVGIRAASGSILLLNARAGRLAGPNQALKATGRATVDFAALHVQPVAAAIASLQRGSAAVDFAAAFGPTADVQATVELNRLGVASTDGELPNVKATIRAALDAKGVLTLNAPFQFETAARVSDLTIAGSCGTKSPFKFEARLASTNLIVTDLEPLAKVFAPHRTGDDTGGGLLSANLAGAVTLDLKHVTAGAGIELSDVTGTIRCGNGAITFDNVHGATKGGGEASVAAAIRRDDTRGVALQADVAATELDAAPWFRASDPRQPPTAEGRFTITSKFSARGRSFADLPPAAMGQLECTSRGGIFRGLAVNVGSLVENSSKLSAWLAAAGDAIKAPFIGRKDQDEITSRAQAANELARLLSNINYDQLGVVILREESDVARVKEFTLISPELRIRGAGVARRDRGLPLSRQLVDLDLTLRARGRTAELMKYLGILENKTDDLGYAGCTLPVRVEGALDRPDTTQLSNRLVALAVEKSGLTEKAVDWINRLRGKSPN